MLTTKLPTQLWRLAVSFLYQRKIVTHIPLLNKFFNQIVWGQYADAWLWREVDEISCPKLLKIACLRGAPLIHVQQLVKGGYNVNVKGGCGFWSLLMRAIVNSDVDVVECLLDNGADVWYTTPKDVCAFVVVTCDENFDDDIKQSQMIDLVLKHLVLQRAANRTLHKC